MVRIKRFLLFLYNTYDFSIVLNYISSVGSMDTAGREVEDRIAGVCRCTVGNGVRHHRLRADTALLELLASRFLLLRWYWRRLVRPLDNVVLQQPQRASLHLREGEEVPARSHERVHAQGRALGAVAIRAHVRASLGSDRRANWPRLGLLHDGHRSAQVHEERSEVSHQEQRPLLVSALSVHVVLLVSLVVAGRLADNHRQDVNDKRAKSRNHHCLDWPGAVHHRRVLRRMR